MWAFLGISVEGAGAHCGLANGIFNMFCHQHVVVVVVVVVIVAWNFWPAASSLHFATN